MNEGLRRFGKRGEDAVRKEIKQLHDMGVITPIHPTPEQKRSALQYLMFLKEKRSGAIKGRGCADGRPQRKTMSKEEASSRTPHTESIIITSARDAAEKRVVVITDIPGAFLQANQEGKVYLRIEGSMAKALLLIKPELYRTYVALRNGKKVLYVKLEKALYGLLNSGLLFWKDLSSLLIKNGFELNPYDTCVANKVIDGTQCTIVYHVDDLKISHVKQSVVQDVLKFLTDRYGKLQTVTGHR